MRILLKTGPQLAPTNSYYSLRPSFGVNEECPLGIDPLEAQASEQTFIVDANSYAG
jgi:hypothetical protein